jgi:YbgC/YbaW family acyl-CoA thioester hydrolase
MNKFTIEERVRWGDVDAAGIIFYGSYIRFFEIGETELFRAVGLPYGKVFDDLNIWLPRVHLECDFHRAAQMDDLLQVSVYEEKLMATAHFVLVATDRENLKPLPVPEQMRQALEPYVSNE